MLLQLTVHLTPLKGKLIVSCQADPGDPMDHVDTVARMATSVLRGGAGGLRAEGERASGHFVRLRTFRSSAWLKTKDRNGEIYITPTFAERWR